MPLKKELSFHLLLLIVLTLSLTACSGGGDAGSSSKGYSISVSVSGLHGTMVLQNNGGDDLTVNSDGDFSFDKAIEDGNSYQISISSSPGGQACMITNDSGIASDNVIKASIKCSYSIGGTITGLNGTLVLQINGADDLTLNSDSIDIIFQYPSHFQLSYGGQPQLAYGDTYDITIVSQPADQVCRISNGSGTVTDEALNISIICGVPYTIGGRVSGLTGGTLTLQNNGGDNLNITENGDFTFSTEVLNSGLLLGNYQVTVLNQPADSICSVEENFLAFDTASANVTDIQVTCVTALTQQSHYSLDVPYKVSIQGNYAYVSKGGLFQTVDISDPASPVLLGFFWDAYVTDIASNGNHAYVTDSGNSLKVIDISDPESPSLVGSISTGDKPRGVAIHGNYAYIANSSSGLSVIDITNPAALKLIATLDTAGIAFDVTVSGSYAYIADRTDGLKLIDISNPATPTLVGNIVTNDAYDVAISDGFAYVADNAGGMKVIDVSDPTAPSITGHFASDTAIGVEVSGSYAYLADGIGGLKVIDISNPATPSSKGSFTTSGFTQGVANSGSYTYVMASGSGLQIIDTSNLVTPSLVGSMDVYFGFIRFEGITVSDSYAYTADGRNGLKIIDISKPQTPTLAGSISTSNAKSVEVDGSYAYVADGSGLKVFDISTPSSPSLAGSIDTRETTNDVAVSGSYAYVADGSGGLKVFDISTPSSPTLTGSISTIGYAGAVAISDSYAYVTDTTFGLSVIDVSNPTSPSLVGRISTNNPKNVAVRGSYAYVADSTEGLKIIDVSDPATPTLVSRISQASGLLNDPFAQTAQSIGVTVSGNYAYVADGVYGLKVIDISLPTNPVLVASYDTPYSNVVEVAVDNNGIYLCENGFGIEILQAYP